MAAFYIILKVIALLAFIVIPAIGPKKRKTVPVTGISKLAINENGYLENFTGEPIQHHHLQ